MEHTPTFGRHCAMAKVAVSIFEHPVPDFARHAPKSQHTLMWRLLAWSGQGFSQTGKLRQEATAHNFLLLSQCWVQLPLCVPAPTESRDLVGSDQRHQDLGPSSRRGKHFADPSFKVGSTDVHTSNKIPLQLLLFAATYTS